MEGHFSLTQCLIIEYGLPENSEADRFATPVVAWDPRRMLWEKCLITEERTEMWSSL